MKNLKTTISLAIALSLGANLAHAEFLEDEGTSSVQKSVAEENFAPSSRNFISPADANKVQIATDKRILPSTLSSDSVRENNNNAVVQIGTPKGLPFIAKGFAEGVPLLTALKQIVPSGWHAKRRGNVSVEKTVSWKGDGRSWDLILADMANKYQFSVIIDWNKIEVIIAPWNSSNGLDYSNGLSNRRGNLGNASITEPSGQNREIKISKTPISTVAAKKVWTLRSDLTLRGNIEAWAKESGWSVSWAAVDYPISQTFSLSGDLDAENGPLAQLVEAYKEAEQPLTIRFFSNKVIRVENASFRQLQLKDELPNRRTMQ